MVFFADGSCIAMVNLNKKPLDKIKFEELKIGMSMDDVKKIDASLLTLKQGDGDNSELWSQHIFDDGTAYDITYELKNNNYYIKDIEFKDEFLRIFYEDVPYMIENIRQQG